MKNHLKLVDDTSHEDDDMAMHIATISVCDQKDIQIKELYIKEVVSLFEEIGIEVTDENFNNVHDIRRTPIFAQAYAETFQYGIIFVIHFYDETNPTELAFLQTVTQSLISVELDIGVSIAPLFYPIKEIKEMTQEDRLIFFSTALAQHFNDASALADIRISGIDDEDIDEDDFAF